MGFLRKTGGKEGIPGNSFPEIRIPLAKKKE
jgi:hypothetical protein